MYCYLKVLPLPLREADQILWNTNANAYRPSQMLIIVVSNLLYVGIINQINDICLFFRFLSVYLLRPKART